MLIKKRLFININKGNYTYVFIYLQEILPTANGQNDTETDFHWRLQLNGKLDSIKNIQLK